MPNLTINGIEYEMVNTVADDMSSTNVLKTIVEEGENSVNSYRLNLPHYNPMSRKPFTEAQQIEEFCMSISRNFWSPYFEDPEPEAESE